MGGEYFDYQRGFYMPKSVDELFAGSRLIAKTINRIGLEPGMVDLSSWRSEAKLLSSPGGSCLSSATLLIEGSHVPTYGIDGRSYGFLFDAEKCNIYDVSSSDSNSNRTSKLEKRTERKGDNLLTLSSSGAKTLDQLASEVRDANDGKMNEILLDVWKSSCVGLFVRKLDITKATPPGLKHYYQSLLEIQLIQKYLIQAFGFPEDLKIVQYSEREGKLFDVENKQVLKVVERLHGFNEKAYPELFRLLADGYEFPPINVPITVGAYLQDYDSIDISSFKDEIISKLVSEYTPFDMRAVDENNILSEPVDTVIGVSEHHIEEVISACHEVHQCKERMQAMKANLNALCEDEEQQDKIKNTP